MARKIFRQNSRLQHHTIVGSASATFSIPQQEDFTIQGPGEWTATDLVDSEIGVNRDAYRAYIRINDQIKEITLDGTATISGSASIDATEIAYGTGTGITSSNDFRYEGSNLIQSSYSNIGTSSNSSIIGGLNNNISNANSGIVIGSVGSNVNIKPGSIISSLSSCSNDSSYSSIIGGFNNLIENGVNSSIIAGQYNTICSTTAQPEGVILGGFKNTISYGQNGILVARCSDISNVDFGSAIVGGYKNNISGAAERSVILGGQNLSLTQSDIVYVPELKVATMSQIITNKLVVWDDTVDSKLKFMNANDLPSACIIASTSSSIINSDFTTIISSNTTNVSNSQETNILASNNSTVVQSDNSIIVGGLTNYIFQSKNSGMFSVKQGSIYNSCYSSILGGRCSTIYNSRGSTIIGSADVQIYSNPVLNYRSTIISSFNSTVCQADSAILNSSNKSNILTSSLTIISNSECSDVCNSNNSSILGSQNSILDQNPYSSILGSKDVNITGVGQANTILGSINVNVCEGFTNAVIASCNLNIPFNFPIVQNSVALGVCGATLSETRTVLTTNVRILEDLRLNRSSGTASINPGSTITVTSASAKTNSKIFVTAQSVIDPQDTFYVNNIINNTSFDVTHTNSVGQTASIAWLIIN